MNDILDELYEGVLEGDMAGVPGLVQDALDAGAEPGVILNDSMIAAMSEVGRLFEDGDYFVPEMLIAARAMQGGLEVLKPHLVASGIEPLGRVVIGTVKGDIHEIGKNLVGMMLSTSGFEVHDLGVDVAPERFVEAAREHDADVIGVSALLTTTMAGQRTVVESVAAAGMRPKVKVIVGGAPASASWASEIGADGYSEDAIGAVALARKLLGAETASA